MRIATWNINSIRARIDRLVAWLERSDVDVLAIQETKIPDEKFPHRPVRGPGLRGRPPRHQPVERRRGAVQGRHRRRPDRGARRPRHSATRRYRGKGDRRAVRRRPGLEPVHAERPGDRRPALRLQAGLAGRVRDYGAKELAADPHAQIALCGDFNIAPTDDDIWSVEYYRGSTHVTPPERQAFANLVDAGFTDVVRPLHPGPGVYTYWDYTQLASRSGAACGSTSPWPARRWRPGSPGRHRPARNARANCRQTMRRSSWSWADADRPTCPVRILVIEHDPADPLLRLGDWLTEAGAELTICRPHAGDAIPADTRPGSTR